jgi:isopenicillin N synthase-like dioxygenase
MKSLPIISLSELARDAGNEKEIKRLYDTCDEHGFFYLKDHGVSKETLDRAIAASRKFFELPESVKLQYHQDNQKVYPKTSRGYSPLYGEVLNQNDGNDPKQMFDLGVEKPLSDEPFTGPNLLPDDSVAPDFARAHFQLQQEILNKVVPKLIKGLALALDLDPHWFDKYFTDPVVIHRTIYYPPGVGGAGKHTDTGIFTVLIQEYFPHASLRVYTKNQWIEAPPVEDAFVINLGDMLQMWTNGLFVSTPHAVMHELPTTRVSIPLFVFPNIDTTIEPLGNPEAAIQSKEVMLKNFTSIWETKEGSGRAKELV